jgi:7-cyano-7-deazaguanine synthase
LTFDYGQRHRHELAAAAKIAKSQGVAEHRVIQIDLRQFGHSALTDSIEVPKDRPAAEMSQGVPITYVPARNTIFLAYALAWSEVLGVRDVFIGVNAIDYSGYPDCRPEFIQAFTKAANLGTAMGDSAANSVEPDDGQAWAIHTPLIQLTKAEIIRWGTELGIDFSQTHSCYDPDPQGRACGRCDSCVLRRNGFEQAGVADPTEYAK